MARINIKNSKTSILRPVDWQIVVENVPPNTPVIGTDKEYWGFSIYRCSGSDKALGVGSADDYETCMSMAAEMLEELMNQARRTSEESRPPEAGKGE